VKKTNILIETQQ